MGSVGAAAMDDTVYVAVGNNVNKTKQLLYWTIHTFSARPICLLHVHQPYSTNSFNRNLSAIEPSDHAIKAFQEQGSKQVHELLDQYIFILKKLKVKAKVLLIDKDDIEKGIAEAIAQHNIRWLVMGEAADKSNSGELVEQESEKAIIVREQAFLSCNIWLICKGEPTRTRVDGEHTSEVETAPQLSVLNSKTEAIQSEMINSELNPNALKYSGCADSGDTEETGNVSSQCSLQSKWSLSSFVRRSKLTDFLFHEEEKDEGELSSEIDGRVEETIIDAKSMRQKEFGVVLKRWKVDSSTLEDKELESLCAKEISRRKEVEEQIVRVKQQVQEMKNQQDEIMHELQMVQDRKSTLKNQLSESQCTVTELEEKIISAVDLLISFREKRDMLRIEHKNAVRKVKVLKEFREADTRLSYRVEFPAFSFIEINEATNDLDPSWKIGEGRYGSVYKGLLCNMHVAIKMLPSYGSQSQLEFQHQVEILSRVRHPNLLTPIGSCVESRSLVYEYLNNGSLESHLVRKDKTSLPWQIRVSIAANICSALIFLHCNDPCIIHGNLKPSKVLLDANFVAKLSDVGIPSLFQCSVDSAVTTTACRNKNESMAYVDPEYLVTSKLTPESDVYSFGVILLQLLTGRPLFGLVRDMKCALEKDNLKSVLDFSAGEWPLYQTKQLACLALRCCEKTWLNRPDLVSEIWSVLEPFRTTCINMPPYLASKKPHHPPPPHFLCPIVQEVMEEPYIAADGYTYEAEAIKEWLNSGHNTSPMTNLKLEHTDLVPNYVLHNAIQEWQQLI
ncbi:PREDICTED: U-box domain-containing protein 32 isoform X2 [Lupinus angustifolius]|uniref:U-box domain-containing protein 32 isoform X2 n=1 Tax=Lupinus angustifolius TaxID=3871 RepID=UPI00092E86DA|nr:PREDICTED: U-box domain-containing protein 32 isoform X2 [Lupinus angustifolius]